MKLQRLVASRVYPWRVLTGLIDKGFIHSPLDTTISLNYCALVITFTREPFTFSIRGSSVILCQHRAGIGEAAAQGCRNGDEKQKTLRHGELLPAKRASNKSVSFMVNTRCVPQRVTFETGY
jgi:hypothetical protein